MIHTKGPWICKEIETSVGRAFKINTPACIDDDHGVVACIYDDSTSLNKRAHDEHEANARLIAAAPELLDVVRDCVNFLADLNSTSPFDSEYMVNRAKALHKRAYTAHSKAKERHNE